MYSLPKIEDTIQFCKTIGAKEVIEVPIIPGENNKPFQCHYNSSINPVLGYYIVKDNHNFLHAFKHSVVDVGNKLIDVTPTLDQRKYNIFCYGNINKFYEHLTYIKDSVYINKYKKETEIMYYVYGLIDPRNNKPFYIGKGKDDRALSHFSETNLNREGNNRKTAKIKKLSSLGYDPMIEFYAQNIEDENLAYQIEESLILKYGRIGHEKNGILTNQCIGANPPNHKGKTYEEIYGNERAKEVIEKRSELQKLAGGYGPKKHSIETKNKISIKTAGKNNPRYGVKIKGTQTAKKISKANKGKKHYQRSKLLFIEGLDKIIYKCDLFDFCKKNGYSYGTFESQLVKNWPKSKRGMNKGLKIRRATETEITSYIVGGVDKDVDEETFKGFSL